MRRYAILFVFLLTACGQKGPLYLPPEQPPAQPAPAPTDDEPADAPANPDSR